MIKKDLSTFSPYLSRIVLFFKMLLHPTFSIMSHIIPQADMIFVSLNHTIGNFWVGHLFYGAPYYHYVISYFAVLEALFLSIFQYLVHVIGTQIAKSHNTSLNTQVNWTIFTSTQTVSFPTSSIWKNMDLCHLQQQNESYQ